MLSSKVAMQVAANLTLMFTECGPLVSRYQAAKEVGFKMVECMFPYAHTEEEVVTALADTGLRQVLINSDPGDLSQRELGFAALPGQQLKFQLSLEKSIKYANAMKCPKIHIMSGYRCSEHSEYAHMETYEANLRMAVERLAQENIMGLIEPINGVSFPGYYLDSYEKGHVQVAQAPDRHEPTSEGELDFKYIFQQLQQSGYEGIVGAEYIPSKATKETLNWITMYNLNM